MEVPGTPVEPARALVSSRTEVKRVLADVDTGVHDCVQCRLHCDCVQCRLHCRLQLLTRSSYIPSVVGFRARIVFALTDGRSAADLALIAKRRSPILSGCTWTCW